MSEQTTGWGGKGNAGTKPLCGEAGQRRARVFAWLEENPGMLERMDELLEVVRNEARAHDKLSQAEAAFVRILGGLGRGVVSNWLAVRDAQEQERLLRQEAPVFGARPRKHSKKNSA